MMKSCQEGDWRPQSLLSSLTGATVSYGYVASFYYVMSVVSFVLRILGGTHYPSLKGYWLIFAPFVPLTVISLVIVTINMFQKPQAYYEKPHNKHNMVTTKREERTDIRDDEDEDEDDSFLSAEKQAEKLAKLTSRKTKRK